MRRGRSFGRRVKRRTAWLPGMIVGGGNTTFVMVATTPPRTVGFVTSFGLVTAAQLSTVGGEDAVLVRTLGSFSFGNGKDGGAGAAINHFMRIALVLRDTDTSGAVTEASAIDLWNAEGLGSEDILFVKQIVVPSATPIANAIGPRPDTPNWFDFDIRVKRKVTATRRPFWQVQTETAFGFSMKQFDVTGFSRLLFMRPAR